jgi:hypothetical protein
MRMTTPLHCMETIVAEAVFRRPRSFSPSMRITAVALILLAGSTSAQWTRAYVTQFGRRVLARTELIVEAKVQRLMPPFRGVTTARLEVGERLHGLDRSKQITLLFIEDYVAPDAFSATLERSTVRYEARRRKVMRKLLGNLAREKERLSRVERTNRGTESSPGTDRRGSGVGIRLAEGERGLFFLERKGASYAMVGYVPANDPLFAAKAGRLRDVLRIESVPALDRRAEKAKDFYLAGIGSDHPWERGNSAREILSLATRYPGLFSREEGAALARRLYEESEPAILATLERSVRTIDAELALDFAREAEHRARERHATSLEAERKLLERSRMPEMRAADLARIGRHYRRAAGKLLADFLRDDAALVRESAAQSLAELGTPSARGPLRRALEREEDLNAAMAMIYALGVSGDPEAVALIATRVTTPELERPSLHALARIGTEAARKELIRHRARVTGGTGELIDDLLREEFAERS